MAQRLNPDAYEGETVNLRGMAYGVPDMQTHFTSAATTAKAQPTILRILAFGIWGLSVLGTMLGFAGGADQLFRLSWSVLIPIVVGLAYQLAVSAVQVVFAANPFHPAYLLTLLASFVPGFRGYRGLIALPWTEGLSGAKIDPFASFPALMDAPADVIGAALVAHLAMGLILLAFDIIPERTFIKH